MRTPWPAPDADTVPPLPSPVPAPADPGPARGAASGPPRRRLWRVLVAGLLAVLLVVLSTALLTCVQTAAEQPAGPPPLRVCADPNNLPYSNRRMEGFENALAELVATELGTTLQYTWWPQRRGFLRKTLKAGLCDLVVGLPAGFDGVLATEPYYRSSYVFVSRADRPIEVTSLDTPALRKLRVGIQLVGDDYANPPAAAALARRGIVENVVGYSVYGDYALDDPAAPIVNAVASGEIDVAVVWGPQAGWYARRSAVPLQLARVTPDPDGPTPFSFDISMGVHPGDEALRNRIQAVLVRRRVEVDAILDRFGVPR